MYITEEMIEKAINQAMANLEMEDEVKITNNNIKHTKAVLVKTLRLWRNNNG